MADRGNGGLISAVAEDSPAARAGIVAGERVVSANGRALADVIDWRWESSEDRVTLEVVAEDGRRRRLELHREAGDWGIDFAEQLFDGVRECANACVFCFVRQLPAGLRPSLYVRDDDFRLSFLHGNFVTLTNVSEEDVRRILIQRLSPLHVSIHAVTPEVRRRLMCPTAEDEALRTLEELMRGAIDVHLQVVLVPGVNDGDELEETLSWAARREHVLSVGVVPMGFTRHQSRYASSYGDPALAAEVLRRIRAWQAVMRVERGETWVQAADELYLAAGAELPGWSEYDGFPQYENGVGLARAFIDEVADEVREHTAGVAAARTPAVLVTGTLFGPVLREVAPRLQALGVQAEVLPVDNSLFGGNVSVTGLLSRHDIVEAIRRHGGPGPYLVPDVVINSDGLLLDDLRYEGDPCETLSVQTGARVVLVPSEARAFVESLLAIAPTQEG